MTIDSIDYSESNPPVRQPVTASVAALVIKAVSKRFKNHQALSDVSLRCESGESIAVIGLNGAGKTTLLRATLGFVGVDQGRIQLFGVDAERPASRQRVAFLPERLLLTPELSGWQSIELLLGVRKLQADRADCEQKLSSMGFPLDQLDAPAKTYSKGMSQKIGLVAAINSSARLLVLDEPFTGLDPRARRSLVQVLLQWRDAGRSLVFTAHSLVDLDRLSDQVAIMHEGRLIFCDSPEILRKQYLDPELGTGSLEQAFLHCIEQSDEAEFA